MTTSRFVAEPVIPTYSYEPCPKCGYADEPRVEWHAAAQLNMVVLRDGRVDPEEEHLHYSCARCGFDWTGPTRDAGATA